jgi:hypothetical protein
MVKARVVQNYGRHLVGAFVEVEEREYHRLRKSDGAGGYTFPVLISQADADALAAKERDARAKAESARAASDTDRHTAEGWAEYQRKASEVLAAKRIEEQRATQAALLGEQQAAIDPNELARRFAENVAAGRGA